MKKRVFILIFAVLSLSTVFAQTKEKPWNLGLYYGRSQYDGDLGSGFFQFNKAFYGFGQVSLSRYLNSWFNLAINGSYGGHGFYEKTDQSAVRFGAHKMYGDLQLQFNFVKKESAMFRPFIFAGVGFRNLTEITGSELVPPPTCSPGSDLVIPGGVGLNFNFYKGISLRYMATIGYTNHDNRDTKTTGDANDWQLDQCLGLTFNLGPKRDTDGDGVADRKDKCPDTPAGALVDEVGCIVDRDKDGFADNQDDCPDNAGIAQFKGCPDKDNDGIMDKDDACPDKAGIAQFKGCPDTDKDGVEDSKDECPTVAGLAQFNGCPDTDGDGITDSKDKCPTEAGPVETQGCPDRDKDGIIDKEDKCPDVFGIIENKGCPEIKQETKQIFERALQGIQFETGKDVIRKNSYGILDEVFVVMRENPEYSLSIFGHTDNTGADDMNMTLSQKRADAVKKYLVDKGVPENRIVEVKGFGETMPVATNDTAEGRTQNRRVEFKVVF
jgi:OmpA-OmpF porin, OOP family